MGNRQGGASTSASSPTAFHDMLHSRDSSTIVATNTIKNTGNTMQGAGGNNPMHQGDITTGPGGTIFSGTLLNIGGMDTKETGKLLNDILGKKGTELSNAPLEKVERQYVEINSLTDSEPRLRKILALLKDVGIQKIGIWGMGGIGKTRTLKLLNNRLEESQSHKFDIVIWVTVTRKGSRRKVQHDIAERLKCIKKDMSDDCLKREIFHHLRGKKFLLILDDIWERINLSEVGIPIPNQANGCKVLLASRDFGVCQQMGTNVEIKMEKLSEEKARSLFNEKVGYVAMSPRIESIARNIIKKCGGLPLAIIIVGSSLRRKSDVGVWRNTLRELRLPCASQIKGMEKEVFSCLRISYDWHPNDCERNLFLYCSLYPEDWKILITELAERCWLEGYIRGVDSIKDARDKGCHMVINLVDASLLERDDNEEYVKMHDILRDFALKEVSGFLVKTGKHVKHPPEEKEWLQAQKISLMGCSLVRLLEMPNCSTLSTLLLQGNDQLTMIPDSFFECMHSLCILDLSRTGIKSLPSSLWTLVNLRGLYLKDCRKLEELPSKVRELKQLEVLHLGGSTAIRYLPKEVGQLTRLKRLIVGFQKREHWKQGWNMELRVPIGIIPKLPRLEELGLYMNDDYGRACVDKEQWDDESMEAMVKEICGLEHLTYLDVYFPKEECLEYFIRHSKSVKTTSEVGALMQLKVHLGGFAAIKYLPREVEKLTCLCILDLSRTKIRSLPSSLWNFVNLRNLCGLYLGDCAELEELPSEVGALTHLCGLYLGDCAELEELPSEVGALTQLMVLHLGGSTRIKYRELGKLPRLQLLMVDFK